MNFRYKLKAKFVIILTIFTLVNILCIGLLYICIYTSGNLIRQYKSNSEKIDMSIKKNIKIERSIELKLLPSLDDVKDPKEKIKKQLESITDWNFDIFLFERHVQNGVLKYLVFEIFKRLEFFKTLRIDETSLNNFCDAMVNYCFDKKNNPYHNVLHAADVTQSAFALINHYSLQKVFRPLELFSIILGAIIHDYKHPGENNLFQKHLKTEVYKKVTKKFPSEESYCERYSLMQFNILIKNDRYNILKVFDLDEKEEILDLIESMILSTNIAVYKKQNSNLYEILNSPVNHKNYGKYKHFIFSSILRTCDISNTCKFWPIHKEWCKRLMEEFYIQTDKLEAVNKKMELMFYRNVTEIPTTIISFIDIFCKETLELNTQILEKIKFPLSLSDNKPWADNLYINYSKWNERYKSDSLY